MFSHMEFWQLEYIPQFDWTMLWIHVIAVDKIHAVKLLVILYVYIINI
jgi:hypothetical protein